MDNTESEYMKSSVYPRWKRNNSIETMLLDFYKKFHSMVGWIKCAYLKWMLKIYWLNPLDVVLPRYKTIEDLGSKFGWIDYYKSKFCSKN